MASELSPALVSDGTPRGAATTAANSAAELDWRRFVRRFAAGLTLLLCLLATFNYLVNPMGRHAPRLLPPVTWNSRPVKAALLRQQQPPPQALILGSSRALKIDPKLVRELTGLPAFNAAVLSAMAEDDLAMLRYAVEDVGAQPRLLVIGVDVEMFHDHLPVDAGLLETPALRRFVPSAPQRFPAWQHFASLLSWEETKLSWRSVRNALTGYPTTWNYFDADGYGHYALLEKERASGKPYPLERRVDAVAAEYVGRYEGYTALSGERVRSFEQMLEYAQAHGIRVVLFITVIHPRVLRVIEPHNYPERYAEVKRLLEQLSAKYGAPAVSLYDFSRVEAFGGSNDWFYDGSHVDERNAELMTRKMLSGAPPEGKPDAVR